MREAERGRFVLVLPPAMAAGVVAYAGALLEPPVWLAPCVVGLAGALAWGLRRWPVVYALCLVLAVMALGAASAGVAAWRAPAVLEVPRKASVVAGLLGAVEPLPNGRRLTLLAPTFDGGAAQGRRVRVRLRAGDETPLTAGDTVRVRALLQPPAMPAYPGAWDVQRDAFFSGLGGGGYALGPVEVVARAAPQGLALWVQTVREGIAGRIFAVLPGAEGAIAATLLTGATAAIPEGDRAAFRDSGLAHLLAIAGLHIGIVMGLVFGATRLGLALSERVALFWPIKALAACTALAAGFGYLVLTGAHVPIMRSFAMAALVTLGVLVGRRAVSLRGLGLAMAVLVLLAPAEVLGVSFQMSFAAVLALIVGYDLLQPWLRRLHGDGGWGRRLAGHCVALALTSALAGTASMPYGAYHFGHIQLYFVLANMLAVPLTALWVMPAGLVALALMPVHAEALALWPMGWGVQAILGIAHAVAAWPAAVLAVPHLPGWGLGVFSLGLGWFGIWRGRQRYAGVVVMALAGLSPWLSPPADILVSADARLIAVRQAGQVRLQKGSGAARFTQEAWLQYWAVTAAMPLPECGAAGCPLGVGVALVGAAADAQACAAQVLISAVPIRLECPGRQVIDRFTVWRDGAQAVWLGADWPVVLSDRAMRGERPWVPPVPTRGRLPAGPALRVAPIDD